MDGYILGTVKYFNEAKGFGFITPDNSKTDILFHFTEINSKLFIQNVERG